jgi:hypothetical protein
MRSIKISLSSPSSRARQRKRQHVPERKAEIIDQHLTARLRMPLGGIERGQQIVQVARARVEIDLGGQLRDQPVELADMPLHESRSIGLEMLDFRGGRRVRKNVGREFPHLTAVILGRFPAPQRVEPAIELALEAIDNQRI